MNGLIEIAYTRHLQVLKYMIVGGIALSIDLALLYGLTEFLKIHYLVSAAIAFIIATGVNYLLCIVWVFERGRHSTFNEVLLVFTVSGIGLLLNEVIMFLIVELFLIWYMIAKLIAAGAVFFWNYSTRKYYVFLR